MARPRKSAPSYRKHSSGQAITTLSDPTGRRRDVLLGPWNSAESKAEYDRVIAAWLANGRKLDHLDNRESSLTNNELYLLFMEHAEKKYKPKDGSNPHLRAFKAVIQIASRLFGKESAVSFSPKRLRLVRSQMIEKGWSGNHINAQISRLRQIYKFGVSEELLPPEIIQGLLSVPSLTRNDGECTWRPEVKPVAWESVEAALPFMSKSVQSIVLLMWFSGCRCDEVVKMRPCDIDQSEEIWSYVPSSHKTEHKNKRRIAYLGPEAQKVLAPWLEGRKADEFVFSPARSWEVRSQNRKRRRGKKRNPKKRPGERYCTATVNRNVWEACKKVDLEQRRALDPNCPERVPDDQRLFKGWSVHQLRHSCGSRLRKAGGIEVSIVGLGHSSAKMNEIYSQRDYEKLKEVLKKVG